MAASPDSGTATGYQVRLPLFEGPLDLLLHLIEEEELDITKVALAQVTDQFLAYLAVLTEVAAENLTDFLVVAARLVLIKSQALLPKPPPSVETEEEDVGDQLARQLRIYKQFRQVAQHLSQRESARLRSYLRLAAPPRIEAKLAVGDLSVDDLVFAIRQALAIRPPAPGVDNVLPPVTVTIGQQMDLIRGALVKRNEVSFWGLLPQASGRVEIIVTLMAALELIKQHAVDVRQEKPFGDIVIFATADTDRVTGSAGGPPPQPE